MLRYALWRDTEKLTTGTYAHFHPTVLDGQAHSLSLCTAQGMPAAFQLVLCEDSTPWALNVGETLWLSQREEYHTVRVAAPKGVHLQIEEQHPDNDGCFRADALLSAPVTEQQAGEARAVYAEIALPPDTPAGKYSFCLRLFASHRFGDETPAGEVTVELTVFPVRLPETNRFYLDLWQHSCAIARRHEVPFWSDAHFAVLEPYVRSLGELGQKAVTLVVSEAPWGGQSCFREYRMEANLFEYSIVPLRKDKDGRLLADFQPMQRYIDLCARYGIREELSLYGLMNVWCTEGTSFTRLAPDDPDALRVRYFDESTGSYRFLRTEAEIEEYIALLGKYFRETGQIDRVRVAADEPVDTERYRASLERVRAIVPEFRFKAAINHAEFIEAFGEEISDFVPYSGHLFTQLPLLQSYRQKMPGKRFLWYTCCGPHWPNTFLRSELCETLIIGLMTSYFRMDGYLRWAYTEWNDHPRADARYGDFANGDTHFVYPSAAGRPLYTLRWKLLRKAIWLYELLERVREEQGDEQADRLIRNVLFDVDTARYYTDGHWANTVYSHDSEAYERLLQDTLEILSVKYPEKNS